MKNVIRKTKTTYLFNYSICVINASPKRPDDDVGFLCEGGYEDEGEGGGVEKNTDEFLMDNYNQSILQGLSKCKVFQKMYFCAINRLTKRKFVDNMIATIKRRKAYE